MVERIRKQLWWESAGLPASAVSKMPHLNFFGSGQITYRKLSDGEMLIVGSVDSKDPETEVITRNICIYRFDKMSGSAKLLYFEGLKMSSVSIDSSMDKLKFGLTVDLEQGFSALSGLMGGSIYDMQQRFQQAEGCDQMVITRKIGERLAIIISFLSDGKIRHMYDYHVDTGQLTKEEIK